MLRDFRIFLRHVWVVAYLVRHITLMLLGVLAVLSVVLCSVERMSYGEALYLTVMTGLTVAYGDVVPQTMAGRVICSVIGLLGVIAVGVTVAVANNAVILLIKDKEKGLPPRP